MKEIAFFGGTGGLGSKIIPFLEDNGYKVNSIGSNTVNLLDEKNIYNYFKQNTPEIIVIFSNYNFNSFFHKYVDNFSEVDKQIDINIKGIVKCLSYSLEYMRKNNYGRIILASSITTEKNIIGTSLYAATKAFYENLVKTICLENASKNITANCIQLGYMDGGLTYTLNKDFLENIIDTIPSKRLGTPKEIFKTIDFLIENSYINGTTIKLTGGL
jgi:NAD(P)-dependent dehydrogenase (short-subunit alcohol dehydrogenase family)